MTATYTVPVVGMYELLRLTADWTTGSATKGFEIVGSDQLGGAGLIEGTILPFGSFTAATNADLEIWIGQTWVKVFSIPTITLNKMITLSRHTYRRDGTWSVVNGNPAVHGSAIRLRNPGATINAGLSIWFCTPLVLRSTP